MAASSGASLTSSSAGIGACAAEVILGNERAEHFCRCLLQTQWRVVGLAAQHPGAAHKQHLDTGPARRHRRGHDIQVALHALDALAGLHLLQLAQLVAVDGGFLVGKLGCGPLHVVGQAHHQFLGLAAQEQRRVLDLSRVLLRCHQLDTGRGAAVDLVLQAGARAIAEEAVLALAHLEHFLQEVQ